MKCDEERLICTAIESILIFAGLIIVVNEVTDERALCGGGVLQRDRED